MNPSSPYLLKEVPLTDLEGKTLKSLKGKDGHEIVFYTADNERYVLKNDYYKNIDIAGNLYNLLNFSIDRCKEISDHYPVEYRDLVKIIRVSTIASCVHIKYYVDLEEVKEEIAKKV